MERFDLDMETPSGGDAEGDACARRATNREPRARSTEGDLQFEATMREIGELLAGGEIFAKGQYRCLDCTLSICHVALVLRMAEKVPGVFLYLGI